MMETSIVEYFENHDGFRCGYCKATNTFYSHGMWAHALTPTDYQILIDRGWRRSGKYCYKPTMDLTCCPMYTIRCETQDFSLTKSQKKVLKKVHRFLAEGDKAKINKMLSPEFKEEQEMETDIAPEIDMQNLKKIKDIHPIKQSDIETDEFESDKNRSACDKNIGASSSICVQLPQNSSQPCTPVHTDSVLHKSSSENSNRPPCRKAKVIRQEKKLQKLLKKGMSPEFAAASLKKTASKPKSLEDFLSEPFPIDPAHKLELRLVPSSLENPIFRQTLEESYSIYKKYQMEIHKDPAEKCSTKQYTRFLVNNPFQLRLVAVNTEEFASTLEESYQLYKMYQMVIHEDSEDECNRESFDNFLIETPMETFQEFSAGAQIYGSYHQQYWLDNKLIAVGVLDILPLCVSSVYFYYDPDYSFLSLGTYAALREIAFTRELNDKYNDLQYYYMGYYIHSCVKMRYKGQYVPSFLMCPETYTFYRIEKCKPKLDVSKYSRLEEDPDIGDSNGIVNPKEILILYNKKKMNYRTYCMIKNNARHDESEVLEYANLVGRSSYRRMLLYRSNEE